MPDEKELLPPEAYGDYILIDSSRRPSRRVWKELLEYRGLISVFVKREFLVQYKQTILGPLWIVLKPFLMSLAYMFIFSGIARIQTDGIPGILFYLGSNSLWTFFASSFLDNANVFRANAQLFGKIYFPRITLPVAHVIIAGIQFFVIMVLFFCFYLWDLAQGDVRGSWTMFFLVPVLLLQLGALGLGCGIILSSATTKYRDVNVIVQFIGQIWMYATPVLFPLSTIPEGVMRTLILLNPVTQPMEIFRLALFGKGTLVPWSCVWSVLVTAAILLIGWHVFSRVEKTFIDTI